MTDEQAAEILARLSALEGENKSLKDRIEVQESQAFAPGITSDFISHDPNTPGVGGDQYARHVVVATNASEEYSKWSGKPVVNAEGLVRNSRSSPVEG